MTSIPLHSETMAGWSNIIVARRLDLFRFLEQLTSLRGSYLKMNGYD